MLQGLVQKREDISRCVLSATEHPMGIRRIFLVAAWLPRFSMTCRTEADIKVEFAMLLPGNCFYFLFAIIPFKGYFSASRGPQCVAQPRGKMRTYIFLLRAHRPSRKPRRECKRYIRECTYKHHWTEIASQMSIFGR